MDFLMIGLTDNFWQESDARHQNCVKKFYTLILQLIGWST